MRRMSSLGVVLTLIGALVLIPPPVSGEQLLMIVSDAAGRVSHAEALESVAGLDDAARSVRKAGDSRPQSKRPSHADARVAPVTFKISR